MTTKKILSALLVSGLAFTLMACASTTAPANNSTNEKEDTKKSGGSFY